MFTCVAMETASNGRHRDDVTVSSAVNIMCSLLRLQSGSRVVSYVINSCGVVISSAAGRRSRWQEDNGEQAKHEVGKLYNGN